MAIAALALWMCTAAVGGYLLAASIRSGNTAPAATQPAPDPAGQPAAGSTGPAVASYPATFDPPSLQRARNANPPYLKALAEFAHPALAITGLAFWIGYVVTRDRLFLAIGLGILLGAIGAGLSWAAASARAARRAKAGAAGDPGAGPASAPLSVPPRLLALHAAGAALTLLFTALIAARV